MKLLRSFGSHIVAHPFLSGVAITLAAALLFVIAPALATFFVDSTYYDQTYTYPYPLLTFYSLIYLLGAPSVIYFLWLPGARRRHYARLARIIDKTVADVAEFDSATTKLPWVWNAAWPGIILAVSIPIFLTGRTIGPSWWLFWIPIWAYFYALGVNYVGSIGAMRWVSMFLRPSELTVMPLHPDKCGGLSFVGDYFVKIYMFVFYFGLMLMLSLLLFALYRTELDLKVSNLGLGVTYIAGAALYIGSVYFALIRTTRWIQAAMRRPRDRILLQLADAVNRLQLSLSDLVSVKTAENTARLKNVDEEIQRLRNLHQAVQATYPTSPFTATWIRGIRATSVIPLLVGAAPIVKLLIDAI